MKKYLSADFERMLGLRFVLCVAGVFLVFMTSTYTNRDLVNITALNAVDNGLYGMSGLFSMVICAAAYSGSLCEDIENRYFFAECFYGKWKNFARSRTLTVFLSSLFIMAIGILCYGFYVSVAGGGWFSTDDTVYQILQERQGWYFCLLKKAPPLFFLTTGLWYGMLSGLMSVLALLFSLYCANKMLILSVPFMGMYFLLNLSLICDLWNGKLNVWLIFQPFFHDFSTDKEAILYVICFTAVVGYILYRMILKRVERRLFHGK